MHFLQRHWFQWLPTYNPNVTYVQEVNEYRENKYIVSCMIMMIVIITLLLKTWNPNNIQIKTKYSSWGRRGDRTAQGNNNIPRTSKDNRNGNINVCFTLKGTMTLKLNLTQGIPDKPTDEL